VQNITSVWLHSVFLKKLVQICKVWNNFTGLILF